MFRKRIRTYALIGAAAVAGVLAAVVPAFGDNHEDAVRLHLGSNYQAFTYGGTPGQPISASRCEIQPPPPPAASDDEYRLVSLSANKRGPGIDSLGIGVKSGGAQGTPCGRVDTTEALTLKIQNGTGFPLEGRTFDGLRLDLELKGGALVNVTLKLNGVPDEGGPFRLASGGTIADPPGVEAPFPAPTDPDPAGGYRATSDANNRRASCAGASDSGPDSGANDNCLWTITGVEFDEVVMTSEVGEFSLEGSGDYGNDAAFDTLFYIANSAPVANDDSAVTVKNTAVDIDVLGNDTDADEESLSVVPTSITSPTSNGGTLAIKADGKITYTPATDFVGTDTFTYRATDGSATSNAATVTVRVDDTIGCDEPLSLASNDDRVTAVYQRVGLGGCPEKPVVLELTTTEKPQGESTIELPTVLFQPRPMDGSPAVADCSQTPDDCADEFFGELSFTPRTKANAPDTLTLEYDPVVRESADDAVFRPMPWCTFDPNDADSTSTDDTRDEMRDALPVGESWCIIEVSVTIENETENRTTWYVYGIGDPFKRAS